MLATESARARRLLLGVLLLGVGAAGALAQAELPTLTVRASGELHVGEHARFHVEVWLPRQAGWPLLLTPFREGQALEVVKGRLLRSDALDPHANPLHFELPVLARAPGSALIGVRLLAYLCDPRCRAVEVEARTNVMVLP